MADAVVYQVFPDRFARSARADERPTPEWAHGARWDEPLRTYDQQQHRQIYGGDLDGIIERLDHIASLGATVLYLTPAFPADTTTATTPARSTGSTTCWAATTPCAGSSTPATPAASG